MSFLLDVYWSVVVMIMTHITDSIIDHKTDGYKINVFKALRALYPSIQKVNI